MNIREHPAYKACELREFDCIATGRSTRQVDEYVQKLFNAQLGEWITPLDHAYDRKADEWLVRRIASRMKIEHNIELEIGRTDKRMKVRMPIADVERLAKFRADQHEFYVTEMKKLYPDWKEI